MLSIIIPTLNEQRYLPKLLRSIKNQKFHNYEIIVADGGSKDNTRKIAKTFGCKIVRGGTPAAGRNFGAKAARGDILLFLDSDVELPPDFLTKFIRTFKRKKLGIASCNFRFFGEKKIDKVLSEFTNKLFDILQYFQPQAAGWCIMVKSSIHKKIKGFDESLVLSEDLDYCIRASKHGKFGIIKSVSIGISPRRLEKEGRLNYVAKCVYTQGYRVIKRKIRRKIVRYELGNHK
ncbi:MAG: glycosyltransferase [Nanoarchaeota archaeon]|nr:MAG: glycosyltransferase [Nanoarchaeota archaeon]